MQVGVEYFSAASPFRWPGAHRPIWMLKHRPIAQRKFLLLRDGDRLVVLIGPDFRFVADYHHRDLVAAASAVRLTGSARQAGGGVMYVAGGTNGWEALFEFWSDSICGPYGGSMSNPAVISDIERQLEMKVRVDDSGATKKPY